LFKRAGIVVGGALILLAVAIYLVANGVGGGGDRVGSEVDVPIVIEDVVRDNIFKEIYPIVFPTKVSENEGIKVVERKKLIFLDGGVGTAGNKQLYYALEMSHTNGVNLSIFVSENVFNEVGIGDRLLVSYVLYRNDVGTIFSKVRSVERVGE